MISTHLKQTASKPPLQVPDPLARVGLQQQRQLLAPSLAANFSYSMLQYLTVEIFGNFSTHPSKVRLRLKIKMIETFKRLNCL